jgi:hypothetical protein
VSVGTQTFPISYSRSRRPASRFKTTPARVPFTSTRAGLSLPIPKLPSVGPSLSPPGPWNEFTAPGWLSVGDFEGDAVIQNPYNAGATTFLLSGGGTISRTIFDFGGNTEGRLGYLVHIDDFSTADTYGLPSSGVTKGNMTITTSSEKPLPPRRLGGCGKFGCHWSE